VLLGFGHLDEPKRHADLVQRPGTIEYLVGSLRGSPA
jgi:hypothetical protein